MIVRRWGYRFSDVVSHTSGNDHMNMFTFVKLLCGA